MQANGRRQSDLWPVTPEAMNASLAGQPPTGGTLESWGKPDRLAP